MSKEISERSKTIDVMKFILIILVVIGHYPNINTNVQRIIFWFHMPLFFTISGYLFKGDYKKLWVRKTIIKYIVPYFSYFILISLLQRNISIDNVMKFLYGGRMYSGTYWFIPCMLITILIFYFLNKEFSKRKIIIIVIVAYLLAHLESIFFLPYTENYLDWGIVYKIPLNVDVCLMSIVYFAIGFYFKSTITKIINKNNVILYLIVFSICLIFIILNLNGILSYTLNMKLGHYYNFILDILIPGIFGIWILMTSTFISKINIKLINFIGINTLPIMYFHIPINGLIQNKIQYGLIGYILVGVLPTLIFTYICSKNRYLEFLFKGKIANLVFMSKKKIVN